MGKKIQYGPSVRRHDYDPSYCLAKLRLGNRVLDAVQRIAHAYNTDIASQVLNRLLGRRTQYHWRD